MTELQPRIINPFIRIVGGCAGTQYGCAEDGRTARTKEEYELAMKLKKEILIPIDATQARILPIEIPIEIPVITIPLPEIIKKIGEEELCHKGIQSLEKTLELDTLGSGILRGSIIGIITGIIVGVIFMKVIK